MGPATSSNRLISLVTGFDLHIRNETGVLPAFQILSNKFFNLPLAVEIVHRHGCEERCLPGLMKRGARDPLDAVQPLLQDIVWTRHEVRLLPAPEFVLGYAVRAAEVT